MLNRPIVSKPDLGADWKFYARAQLAKQRGGRTGFIDFMYIGENTRFANWPVDMEKPRSPVRTKGGDL